MGTLNLSLVTSDLLIMKSSLYQSRFKHLDFEDIVVSCSIAALEELRFDSLSLDVSELLFSSLTQYVRNWLQSETESFALQLKNEKLLSVWGNLKFLNSFITNNRFFFFRL
jgi:hypothetical protein